LTVDTLASWLRCPVCAKPLEHVERLVLGCTSGHRFDVNKRGYVNLVPSGSTFIGDSAAMLEARAAVLESGLYSPIADVLATAVADVLHDAGGFRILDAGVGTGYYLNTALDAAPGSNGLAMDISPSAVARATRGSDAIDGLVADTWSPLPVRDAVCDVVLNVFAPRNIPEFHRVLKPGGTLLVVVPLADHLAELRTAGRMLDVPPDKSAAVMEAATPLFAPVDVVTIRADLSLTPAIADALVGMGPSAHHASSAHQAPSDATGAPEPTPTTLAVQLLILRRTAAEPA
jgi:23S rRNA (guanine745-N1)-methyltransferase